MHESKFPFVSRIEFIRSKVSNCSAHVYGATDRVQVLDAGHDAHLHLATLGRRLRARVEGGPETLADLLHARLQLLALEEDDEHRLVDLVSLREGCMGNVRLSYTKAGI